MRIGLLGGSFNPPHDAHRALSLLAMKRLQLDRIWWLVTPGNPLKDNSELPPLQDRMAQAQALADHPRIAVSGIEAVIGTQYTRDTLAFLMRECAGVKFVWLMGADNLKSFHRWKNWRAIANMLPIAVVDRGGVALSALHSPAGQVLARARIQERMAARLAEQAPPAFVFLHGMKSPLSSTMLRAQKLQPSTLQNGIGNGQDTSE